MGIITLKLAEKEFQEIVYVAINYRILARRVIQRIILKFFLVELGVVVQV
jgi:hypothetical protein